MSEFSRSTPTAGRQKADRWAARPPIASATGEGVHAEWICRM